MSPSASPHVPAEMASLAPPSSEIIEGTASSLQQETMAAEISEYGGKETLLAYLSSHASVKDTSVSSAHRLHTEEDGAAKSIELAYGGLHRAQACWLTSRSSICKHST